MLILHKTQAAVPQSTHSKKDSTYLRHDKCSVFRCITSSSSCHCHMLILLSNWTLAWSRKRSCLNGSYLQLPVSLRVCEPKLQDRMLTLQIAQSQNTDICRLWSCMFLLSQNVIKYFCRELSRWVRLRQTVLHILATLIPSLKISKNVNFALEQATKVHRGSRVIALLFL
jgi:hypothetical protein